MTAISFLLAAIRINPDCAAVIAFSLFGLTLTLALMLITTDPGGFAALDAN
jgi:uncharacterized membrane protein YraQ (UPF0718 family)